MGKIVLRGGLKVKGSLASGAGDDLLTRDATTADVGIIDGSITTLPENQIFVGNASSVPTAVAVSGDIGITSAGVTSISTGVIVNADVNASAGIALTKLEATTPSRVLVSDASGFITVSSATSTEVGYLSGVTSAIQTQLNSKQATITGGATTITSSNLTALRALTSSTTGKVEVSSVTSTELGYLSGVTSAIQPQLDGKLTVNLTSPVDGSILYNVSGEWVNLNPGSNGEVLTLAAGVPSWAPGTSNGIPAGGTTSQYLIKNSSTDYDVSWDTLTIENVDGITSTTDDINLLQGLSGTITGDELSRLAGVTSPIQTQLDGKLSNSLSYNYIFVGGPTNTATQLAPGSNGTLLTMVGGVPTWQEFSASGDVIGPASSTDNAIVRWNGTPGDSIQDSGILIDDTNNITGISTLSSGQISVLNQSELRLYATGSVNYVGIRSSSAMGADYTITLPDAAPASDTFLKYDGANYVWDTSGSINGPVSSTDNALVRWDGTSGDTIKDSGILVDDINNITGVNSITTTTVTNDLATGILYIRASSGADSQPDGSELQINSGGGRPGAPSGNSGDIIITPGTPTGSGIRGTILSGYYHGFTTTSLRAAIGIGSLAGDPSSLSNGDMWYNSSSNELKARINGASVALGSGGVTSTASAGQITISDGTNLIGDNSLVWDSTNKMITIGNIDIHNKDNGTGNSIFVGSSAGNLTNTGANNISVGSSTLAALTSGNFNTSIGHLSGQAITSGNNNTLLGSAAGNDITTGDSNVIIGRNAGLTLTTGDYNVLIGADIHPQSVSGQGQLSIQNIIFGVGNFATGTAASVGGIGIGVPSPTAKLDIAASTVSRASLRIYSGVAPTTPNEGDIWSDGTNLYMYIGGVTKTFTLV